MKIYIMNCILTGQTIHIISQESLSKLINILMKNIFNISDRKTKKRRQEFLDEFVVFMDAYFKED